MQFKAPDRKYGKKYCSLGFAMRSCQIAMTKAATIHPLGGIFRPQTWGVEPALCPKGGENTMFFASRRPSRGVFMRCSTLWGNCGRGGGCFVVSRVKARMSEKNAAK